MDDVDAALMSSTYKQNDIFNVFYHQFPDNLLEKWNVTFKSLPYSLGLRQSSLSTKSFLRYPLANCVYKLPSVIIAVERRMLFASIFFRFKYKRKRKINAKSHSIEPVSLVCL